MVDTRVVRLQPTTVVTITTSAAQHTDRVVSQLDWARLADAECVLTVCERRGRRCRIGTTERSALACTKNFGAPRNHSHLMSVEWRMSVKRWPRPKLRDTAPTNVQPPTSLVQNGIPLIEAWTPCGTCAVSSSNVLSMSDDLQINRRLSQLRYTRPLSGAGSHHSTTPFRCPPAHTPRVRTIGMSPYQYRKDVSRREAKLE